MIGSTDMKGDNDRGTPSDTNLPDLSKLSKDQLIAKAAEKDAEIKRLKADLQSVQATLNEKDRRQAHQAGSSAGFDEEHNGAQNIASEFNKNLSVNDETVSNHEAPRQQASYSPLPAPSPSRVSSGPHGAQDHPTQHLQSTLHATLPDEGNFGGLTVHQLRIELQEHKKFLKKVKEEAESELAVSRSREEAALKEKEAALREKEAALEEERKKFTAVMSQLGEEGDILRKKLRRTDGADASSAHAKPLDRATPGVQEVGPNVLTENRTINNSRTDVTIHEGLEELLEALFGEQMKVGKTLYQKIVEEGVFYWSFMVDNTKSCDLLLRMRVERQDEDGVVVGVESVEEEELEATSLPNPHSTASKKFWLPLKEGTIFLRPLQFGQTLFTFKAQVDVGEVTKDSIIASPSLFRKSPISVTRSTTTAGITSAITGVTSSTGAAVKKLGTSGEAAMVNKLFCKLADLLRKI
ncbi:hypothetical protein TrST_g8901 [Triparma strigata]|uniref:Uncharacterized protein n=1 Tax=Triparma strigata TaxID=1606541 RepID=A0A9W7EJR9_9STRA|nr:hypothetical protein TrST_g8901 [Triparma strigata]